ncbi:MAG TPA: polysaccharide deacetylase family protein [Bacteroidales bacterium]|nr:polysaccharide deacetylase family protein [Bacteroidales bacterium]
MDLVARRITYSMRKMYLTSPPSLLRWLMPSGIIWEMPGNQPTLYLTFDDGPITGVTDDTLAVLESHRVTATFFCVGKNVREHPALYNQIIQAGHAVGNHTMNHLNGYRTPAGKYIQDVEDCTKLVNTLLFRPPYGRITRKQASLLKSRYKIIMWSILSADFDPDMNVSRCYDNVMKNIHPGAIISLHDNPKTAGKIVGLLNRLLPAIYNAGYDFSKIDYDKVP